MKFHEYINRKNLNESQEVERIDELSGDEATEVNFGLFSWGGGGEIDAMGAAAAAAALIVAKTIYNGVIYGMLQSSLPAYLEKYKQTEAPKSRDIFDEKYDKEVIQPLKDQKNTLLGKGGERSDQELERGEDEKSAKQKIEDYFKKAKDAAEGNPAKKEQLEQKKQQALKNIDMKVQKLQNQIEIATNKRDVLWDRMKEDWRKFSDKHKKMEERFIEVRDSVLASAFRKKWEEEFTTAKNQANIEVLNAALKLATENKNQKEIDAIQNSIKRAEAVEKEAQQALADVDADFEAAEGQNKSLEDFGVQQFIQADTMYMQELKNTYGKWNDVYQELSKEEPSTGEGGDEKKAEELKNKIEKAEKKIKSGEGKAQQAKDAGDTEKASKIDAAITKLKGDLESYKEELAQLGESVSYATYFSLSIRINETIRMIDLILEEDGEKKEVKGSFSDVKAIIMKAINAAKDEDKKTLASEALTDVQKIKEAELKSIEARNKMAELFKKNKDKEGDLPKGAEQFARFQPQDPKEQIGVYDDTIAELKEKGAEEKEKPKEQKSDKEQGSGDEGGGDGGKDQEAVDRAEQELEKHRNDVLNPLKEDLENLKNEDNPDEGKLKDLEFQVKKAQLQELKLELQVATLKDEGEKKNELTNKINDLTDEIQASGTKEETTEPEESEEVKTIKKDIEDQKIKIEDIKKKSKDSKSPLSNPDVLRKVISQEEDKLKELERKLEDTEGKPSEKKESNQTKIAPKYMKFEEFLAIKNRK